MNMLFKPFGAYETNCYILKFGNYDIVIDPGIGAVDWVLDNTDNLVAILNTHGHFDHVWSNAKLQESTGAKLYIPVDDGFMLQDDIFGMGMPSSAPDYEVAHDECVRINDTKIKFHHFPGHTMGCSAIEVDGHLFSGDFIFKNSIGRTDFPYSDSQEMAKSLKKFGEIKQDMPVHPGHGGKTTIKNEQANIVQWLRYLGE